MKFCTNCGSELINNPKFCPSCGYKIIQSNNEDQPKMHKRQSKSLKDKALDFGQKKSQDYLKDKAKDFVNEQFKQVKQNVSSNSDSDNSFNETIETSNDKTPQNQKKNLGLWTMVYFIVNILLSFSPTSDEKIGLMMFSFVVLLIVLIRYKKDKPYNILVKIILGLQIVFTIALIGAGFEDGYWTINIIYLVALLFAELMIMFKGNSK